MNSKIDQTLAQPERTFLTDGVQELVLGLYLICLGLAVGLPGHLAMTSYYAPLFIIVPTLLTKYATGFLKGRFVYPRLGYVNLR